MKPAYAARELGPGVASSRTLGMCRRRREGDREHPGRGPLRLVHVQPRPAAREPRRRDRGGEERRRARVRPRRTPTRRRGAFPGPRAARGRRLLHRAAGAATGLDAGARRLPRPPGDGRGRRRPRRTRDARPRQGLAGAPRRPGDPRRPAEPVRGGALPLAGRDPRGIAGRSRAHGLERRRPRDGDAASRAAEVRRAVPPRVDPHARRPHSRSELPGARQGPRAGPLDATRPGARGLRASSNDPLYDPGTGRTSPPGIRTNPSGAFPPAEGSSTSIGEYGRGCSPPLIRPEAGSSPAIAVAPWFVERAGAVGSLFEPIRAPAASIPAITTIAMSASHAPFGACLPVPSVSILVAICLASSFG